jgi:hypothetical protein
MVSISLAPERVHPDYPPDPPPPYAWQRAFRAIAAQLPPAGLIALARGLERDDLRILQGATTQPPPLQACADWPIECACPVGFAAWQGAGLSTVGEVEEAFARACHAADRAIGEEGGVRHFLNWADDTDRATMRWELRAEVLRILRQRGIAIPPLPRREPRPDAW